MIGGAVFIAWAMLNHSNLDVNLRFLEPVLITPRLHHIHHLAAGGDRNLGTIFTFWDRLRGRLDLGERPAEAPLGVPGEPNYPQGLWLSMREPFKRRALRGPDGVDS